MVINLTEKVVYEGARSKSLHFPLQVGQHQKLHSPNGFSFKHKPGVSHLLPISPTSQCLSDWKYSNNLNMVKLPADQSNSFLTCNSIERGTLVSSTLAATDKQATDNNLTIQGLLVFMPTSSDQQE